MTVLNIATTNLRRFLRDRSNLFFVFVLPLGIVLLIGAQFGGGFQPRIGVVAGDGQVASSMVESLRASDEITVVDYEAEDDLLLAVERGVVSAGMVVPDEVEQASAAVAIGFVARPDGLGPQLRALVAEAVALASEPIDATRFLTGQGVDPDAARTAALQPAEQTPDVAVEVRTTGELLFPAGIGQSTSEPQPSSSCSCFLTGLAGSAAIIQTGNLGVASRMMATPASVGSIVLGEALGRFVIVLVQGLYIVTATALAFRVDWGDPLGAGAVLVVFALVGAGAALLFGSLFSNDQQAGSVAILAGIGLAAIGGSMLPLELYGDGLRTIANLTPHAGANDAFAELVRHDATFVDVLPQLAAMMGFAILFLLLATWRMRQVLTS